MAGLRTEGESEVEAVRSAATIEPMPLSRLLASLLAAACSAAPVPVFDGRSLAGWEGDAAWWRVEAGEIRGGRDGEKVPSNLFLATEKSYQNFELTLKVRLNGTGFVNGGIQIRSVRVPGSTEMSGYQCDYGPGWYGKLYDESRRNRVISDVLDAAALKAAVKEGDWNEYRIRAEGPRIRTWINGVQAQDYVEKEPGMAQDGRIGIQLHSGGVAAVQAKDVMIEELPPTPGAPTWATLPPVKPAAPKPKAAPKAASRDTSYNNVKGVRRAAEEQQKLFRLPEGFTIELVAKESDGFGKFIMLVFDQRGRAWSSTALEYPVDANENPAAAEALYKSKARDKVVVFDTPFASGPQKPRVFADGLAIPEGVLPYRDGAVVQHGHDVVFLRDTDGDGAADRREVLLAGFGIQDSHLFPHQFTRAPWGWFWLAQGAFNSGKVGTTKGDVTDFPNTRMARFRPDGGYFEPTSTGPCNIWGLAMTGEGEVFIQEANDFGYPVMPFHEYAWYPGCADRLAKSYQPPFPVQAPGFKMGGTGLSGLALSDAGVWPEGFDGVMYVANPITSKVNAVRQHRAGSGYRLEKLDDLVSCDDPFFRPIAMTMGPDGCLYVVDWYNKIISHNEVARSHPDRDKQSGRIWRIRPKGFTPAAVPDYTRLPSAELIARLGSKIAADAHLAWQTLADRRDEGEALEAALSAIASDAAAPAARRIQALWVMGEHGRKIGPLAQRLLSDPNRNIRREGVNGIRHVGAWAPHLGALTALADDPDAEVRAAAIKTLGEASAHSSAALGALMAFARPSLDGPMAPDRRGQPAKAGVAYEREFERFLVRMYLERQPEAVAAFLADDAARSLPAEGRMFAALALDPKVGAPLVAQLVGQLSRAPGPDELLAVAKTLDQPESAAVLRKLLADASVRVRVVELLLAFRTDLDAAKVGPVVAEAVRTLLAQDAAGRSLAVRLTGGFQLSAFEDDVLALLGREDARKEVLVALQQLRTSKPSVLLPFIGESGAEVSRLALDALVASRSDEAPALALKLYPDLALNDRKGVLEGLSGTKAGAKAVAAALASGVVAAAEVDPSAAEKLAIALGDGPELADVSARLGGVFRSVLLLDGSDTAVARGGLTLKGPFTVETWVRLDGKVDNNDSILGAPGVLDLNFAGGFFRAYLGGKIHDAVISSKPVSSGIWTHVAVTRDAQGVLRLFQDGELTGTAKAAHGHDLAGLTVGWSTPKGGTQGALAEYRIWNIARRPEEVRSHMTRTFAGEKVAPAGLVFVSSSGDAAWGKLGKGARIARTTDAPPLLNAAQFAALESKTARFTALAAKGGDAAKGRALAALCQSCHMINGQGGQIGPNLSGAGAMGMEAVIRNIIDPNAAIEAAYRIFRIETRTGEVIESFYVSEDATAYVIRQPGGPDRRVPRAEVRSAKYLRRSLMPEGLLDGLDDGQIADLFAYLATLK
ncbi:MAG: PVC-type heme-binding CxxCH protein [Opitutales bacterium]